MPTVQPIFDAAGGLSLIVCEPTLGAAVVIDPIPGKWSRYEKYAARSECTIAAVLATSGTLDLPDEAPALRVFPEAAEGEEVRVNLGGKVRVLPVGLSRAVMRAHGLFIGVVVVSTRGQGELAFVIPDGGLLLAGGRLCGGEHSQPVSIDDLVPDWALGLVESGDVYCTSAPHGIFKRPIAEEIQVRDTTRSRILRRLREFGTDGHESVASALGLVQSAP